MNRIIYKVIIDEQEIAKFYDLEYAFIFIKAMCEKYYNQIKIGFNFTIKEEVVENE